MDSSTKAKLENLVKSKKKLRDFFYTGSNLNILNRTLDPGFNKATNADDAAARIHRVASAALAEELKDNWSVVAFLERLSRAYEDEGVDDFPYRKTHWWPSSLARSGWGGGDVDGGTGVKYARGGGRE